MVAQRKFRVDPEALTGSAVQVSAQGEDLADAHLSSDNRMTTVQSGWVGASACALSAKTTAWLQASHALLARIGAHALDLNNDAIEFAARERDNVAKLRAR